MKIDENYFPWDKIPDIVEPRPSTEPVRVEEIEERVYEPVEWLALDIMPEGLTLLAGDPKVGKTRLATNLAVSIARGLKALERFECKKRKLLCLFLEDSERRAAQRIQQLMPPGYENLIFVTDWAPPQGAFDKLDRMLGEYPDIEVVIVDIWARIQPPRRGGDVYAHDYNTASAFKKILKEHEADGIVLHHTNKGEQSKILQRVSGTHGLIGACDTILVLDKKNPNSDEAVLHITGREVESQRLQLQYDPETGRWKCLGDADFYALPGEWKEIYGYVAVNPEVSPRDVAGALGMNYNTIKSYMRRMYNAGYLSSTARGKYKVVDLMTAMEILEGG